MAIMKRHQYEAVLFHQIGQLWVKTEWPKEISTA